MSQDVSFGRLQPSANAILTGQAVQSATWSKTASLNNWTLGRGGQLVPCYVPQDFSASTSGKVLQLAAGTKYTFLYRTQPRYQALERVWSVYGQSVSGPTEITMSAPSATPKTISWGPERGKASPAMFRETLAAQSQTTFTMPMTISVASGLGNAYILSVGCTEVPRPFLATGVNDKGADTKLIQPRLPICDNTAGFGAIPDAVSNVSTIGRRCSLIQWSVPHRDTSGETLSFAAHASGTTAVTWFRQPGTTDGLPILERFINASTTTVKSAALLKTGGGGKAEFRIIGNAHGTGAYNGTANTTWTWVAGEDITVHAEDYNKSNFLLGGTWDWIYPELRNDTGGQDAYCAAVSIWSE